MRRFEERLEAAEAVWPTEGPGALEVSSTSTTLSMRWKRIIPGQPAPRRILPGGNSAKEYPQLEVDKVPTVEELRFLLRHH